mmetsp:Transcript_12217/g.44570  ORF Transcript_12217/g.44570 Transcript_12217/m.44570 type:complete len:463 (+) Transcript_12217:1730-3118(+)
MLRPQLRQHPDHVRAAVLRQRARDHLHRLADSAVWPLLDALHGGRLLGQRARDGHLHSAATGQQPRVLDHVACHAHRILQVALHLVEHIAGSTAQDDGAGLGVLTVHQEGEVLVAELLDLEEAGLRAHVALLDLITAVHNGGTRRSRDTVVVGLAQAPDGADARLAQEVARQVTQALLRDDHVRLHRGNVGALLLDPLLLHAQQRRPVLLLHELHIGLVLPLLVLEGAVEQQHARVLDGALHAPRGHHVLLEHDAAQHAALLDVASRDLLHLRILLDVDVNRSVRQCDCHRLHGLERQLRHQWAEVVSELGADAALHDVEHLVVVVGVEGECDLVDDLDRVVECAHEGTHDDGGVDVLLQERLRRRQDLARQDDHGGGAVAHFLILSPAELDHGLGRGMAHVDLAQDGVAIVGEHNAAGRIQQHLEHRARAQRGADDVRYRLGRADVADLRLAPGLALGLLV